MLSESHLSRSDIEKAVIAAKANVDAAYKYSRQEWVYKSVELLFKFFSDWKKGTTKTYTVTIKDILNGDIYKSDLSTQRRSINRIKRSTVNPADILRLLKQPVGPARTAVRAADYMDNAVRLLKTSLGKRHKRSINATGVYPLQLLWNLLPTNNFVNQLKLKRVLFALFNQIWSPRTTWRSLLVWQVALLKNVSLHAEQLPI